MDVLCFKEEEKILSEKLYLEFGSLNLKNANQVVQSLKSAKVLRHQVPKKTIDEMVYDFKDKEVDAQEYYYFKYVGIVMVKDICLIIYPKYIKDIDADFGGSRRKLLQILQVIDKYQSLHLYETDSDTKIGSFLALQIKIIRDYLEFGLYSDEKSIIELNGEGAILWEKTVNESIAYLIDDAPFYLDYYTENKMVNENHLIRRIHATVITEISHRLAPLLSILGVPEIFLSNELRRDFGDDDYLDYLIEQELSRQFITSKQIMLHDLLNYIRNIEKHDAPDIIEMYGTSSFNLVWEDICQCIYQDNLNDNLNNLHLKLKGSVMINQKNIEVDYTNKVMLKDVVEKPEWLDKENNKWIAAKDSYRLDVLHINHQTRTFELFDAKYYLVELHDKKISGQPGIEDITKQYFYRIVYQKLALLNGYSFENTFIIPWDELSNDFGEGQEVSIAKLDILDLMGLKDIKVIARDCEIFFTKYLSL